MSQNNSFKSNVINRLLDINRNISDTILENNLQQSISNALTAVSSTFKSNSFIMDVIANSSSSNQMMTEQTSIFNSILHNPIKVEKKLFDRLNKLAEKVLKYCQCEKLKLINSPPYIIDIIPDICFILNAIQTSYENKMHVLNDIEYFNILSRNLLDKLNKIAELFKFSGKRIYDETSDERVRLTKYTLILSHMLAEMRSMFPNNVYEGQSFRIAKTDAADFWRQNFKEKAIISWEDFEKKLNNVHKITHKMESFKLRSTIQLTESNYVSIFEFDIFTRLFQPWSNLLDNWKFLATAHPAYSAFSTYDEIHKRLEKFQFSKPGSYLYRLSCTKLGQWAIGYVTNDNKILQTIPQSLIQALIDGQKQNLYLYPNGLDFPIDISKEIEVTAATRVQISREQHDMYCDMGTSFQLCKICSENNKDRKLEPCGHMICSVCLESWQDHNTRSAIPTCPFCRCEIKSFEPIIISPFEELKRKSTLKSTNSTIEISNNLNKFEINQSDDAFQNEEMDGYLSPSPDYMQLSSEQKISPKNANQPTPSSSNTSVTNLIQQYESSTTSAVTAANKIRLNSSEEEEEENYLVPNSFNTNNKPAGTNNENLIKETKIKETIRNSISDMHLADLGLRDTSNSNRSILNPIPPVFPPPLPPPPTSTSMCLIPPSIPAPMPPNHQSSLLNCQKNRNLIVKQTVESLDKNLIQIKIENNHLLDELTHKFGYDRIKLACALFITNNDITLANDILQKCNKI